MRDYLTVEQSYQTSGNRAKFRIQRQILVVPVQVPGWRLLPHYEPMHIILGVHVYQYSTSTGSSVIAFSIIFLQSILP